jgi:hypothetical protein
MVSRLILNLRGAVVHEAVIDSEESIPITTLNTQPCVTNIENGM